MDGGFLNTSSRYPIAEKNGKKHSIKQDTLTLDN